MERPIRARCLALVIALIAMALGWAVGCENGPPSRGRGRSPMTLAGSAEADHPPSVVDFNAMTASATANGPRPWRAALSLSGIGTRGALVDLGSREIQVDGPRVRFVRDGVVEWYERRPAGLEFGVDIAKRPPRVHAEDLVIRVGIEGTVEAETAGSEIALRGAHGVVAYVRDLVVRDANDVAVPARMAGAGRAIDLYVDDRDAKYPLHIDPVLTLGTETKLTAQTPTQNAMYGSGVAIQGDTALVGAAGPSGVVNALDIWTRSQGSWSVTQSLVPDQPEFGFGSVVTINGDTLAACGNYRVYAYVFRRVGVTWSQTQTIALGHECERLALGGGRLVVIAGGTAVYADTAGTFVLEQEIEGADGSSDIPMAFDGNVLFAQGAIWERSGATWTMTQVVPITGVSVAVNGDNLIGGGWETDDAGQSHGIATIYGRTANGWVLEQTLRMPQGIASNSFGVALAIDGNVAVVANDNDSGLIPALNVFLKGTSGWTYDRTIEASDASYQSGFGEGIALSGSSLIATSRYSTANGLLNAGAAFIYDPIAGQAAGQPCNRVADCAAGVCVDGVCCNATCSGQCEACDVKGSLGVCSPVEGEGPHGSRASCGPFACSAAGCLLACTNDSGCALGRYCNAGACVLKKADAAACGSAHECSSGSCSDGVCCDQPCSGQCETCNAPSKPGTCTPVVGEAAAGRAPCASGDETCGEACRPGNAAKCTFASVTTGCGVNACSNGVETRTAFCNGNGVCAASPTSCGAYRCAATRCNAQCAVSADCADGYACEASRCAPQPTATCSTDHQRSTERDGTIRECSPYVCGSTGACADACVSSDECAAHYACDVATKACIAETGGESAGGCSVSTRSASPVFGWFLPLVAAAAARRQRRSKGRIVAPKLFAVIAVALVMAACSPTTPASLPERDGTTASALTIGTETKIIRAKPSEREGFGYGVAIDGDTAAIGGEMSGVDVWQRGATGWAFQQALTIGTAEYFGAYLALGGDFLAASGLGSHDISLFHRVGGVWTFEQTISLCEVRGIAISGTTLLAYCWDGHTQGSSIYVRTAGVWTLERAFQSPPATSFYAIALDGDTAFVEGGLWQRTAGIWTLVQTLPDQGDAAGAALQDGTLIVGSQTAADSMGFASVYVRGAATWTLTQTLTPAVRYSYDGFAQTIALDGAVAVFSTVDDGVHVGTARVFERVGDEWSETRAINGSDEVMDDSFGEDFAMRGHALVVGAFAKQVSGLLVSGAAYIYDPLLGQTQGVPCARTFDCTVGACADGVCCNRDCLGQCEACDVAGSLGLCSPVLGVPHGGRPDCGRYVCSAGACKSECTTDSDCAPTSYCLSGSCTPKRSVAAACSVGRECSTGFCVDGVCCDGECKGQCEACGLAQHRGACTAVEGEAAPGRPACAQGDPICGSACRAGNRATCEPASALKACGAVSCVDGIESRASFCDGKGMCNDVTRACGAYRCGGSRCMTSCAASADCADGYACAKSECVPRPASQCSTDRKRSVAANGAEHACSPYFCDSLGKCAAKCSSTEDCDRGFACDVGAQTCTPTTGDAGDGEGCVIGPDGLDAKRGPRGGVLLVVVIVLALVACRRRRRPAQTLT